MKKLEDVYKMSCLMQYFTGGAVVYSVGKADSSFVRNDKGFLDSICEREGLNVIGEAWRKIEEYEATTMLYRMLRYNLAFMKSEDLTFTDTQKVVAILMEKLELGDRAFYTNWENDPWEK